MTVEGWCSVRSETSQRKDEESSCTSVMAIGVVPESLQPSPASEMLRLGEEPSHSAAPLQKVNSQCMDILHTRPDAYFLSSHCSAMKSPVPHTLNLMSNETTYVQATRLNINELIRSDRKYSRHFTGIDGILLMTRFFQKRRLT